MTLGTADGDGRPWVSPVYYAPEGYAGFYWVSSPEATHSRNIATRPEVSIVIFDSRAPIGSGQGVYVRAASIRRPAWRRGAGVDLDSSHNRTSGSGPHRWTRSAEGVGLAPGALARRLAMVSSCHTRTRCLLGCGSGGLHAIWGFLGGGGAAGTPSGIVAISASFLADTDLHRRLGRGARLARVRAPAASHPLQRPGSQCGPWRDMGAVAPPPALDGGKRDVSPTNLVTPLGPNGEVDPLHLGLPAHPRKRSNRHALSWGDQPVPRVSGSG